MELRARYTRAGRLPSGLLRVTAHATDGPDGDIAESPGTGEVLWTVDAGGEQDLARVVLGAGLLDDAPPLWFVAVDEPRASPAAANLVAYADPVLPPGTIVTKYRYGGLGVPNDRQVGAVRWYVDGGTVHQLFVQKEWRRRRVASALLYTADAVHQSHGWPGHLHGDGKRTVLGHLLVESFRHPQRIALLDEVMAPMDPGTAP
jgi:GNAT superfamily N-acetyltransferase